ncbi:excinuclease ABC subunit B [Candidatus Adlerbacteria bacterium RIFOXYC1_FULL_48_26]|uniref:UvrABC system protein B n=1 Tax=Candidatus Adlerbacteria bacterium RIFOXYC1_FULL_48_26 TaxID=1797247 RepID=A0A1F4Y3F1_9BACT|nr:MAG: excinuclease ABC subunit B [Candidatus Adlerbacteria bacterium RIFOXYC1_FULL_48_26]OGC93838.1 MAG: excinuclease ABC subunit B [Candidatus Adlerbacteria bacterium RIFOXYB1_FULL_48_10]OGC96425.1 MAG: excinuclease ABC subunit B [Candidatus Adlerbacteria bacterium RIFOXYD1_FULL_48_8]
MAKFSLKSEYKPAGDQPKAIEALVKGIKAGTRDQTLLGVTGSGKTFTAANVIQQIGKPTLVIAHNKTLAAQLAQEYREFFPDNAVHYFVSYYDYYQPEAYVPHSDTYIEKEAQINEEIDRLRHASTQALLTRDDVIIVASVSCIYSLGSPEEYRKVHLELAPGMQKNRAELIRELIAIYFERTTADLSPGKFRALGNSVEIMPTGERVLYRVEFEGETIVKVRVIDAISRAERESLESLFLFPAKHYVTPKDERDRAIAEIKLELKERLAVLERSGKVLEAERLKRRTNHDIALIREIGVCPGIENYSRHFDGRKPGEPPFTLLDYFPHKKDGTPDFLTIIDESHVTVSQIGGMYAGDRARKENLIEFGFRLPSAVDNRPLQFEEFEGDIGQRIYTSATPGVYEKEKSGKNVVEQIIRPTGLIDPEIIVRPVTGIDKKKGQVQDFLDEAEKVITHGGRVLVTTLTKKMAEDLSEYLKDRQFKAAYIHSEVLTLDRITILTDFRKGLYDVLVGVNLLREGLDLPEVELVAILDADKEGFLRSETSLIQTIGRAARNVHGRVIMYADQMTGSLEKAMSETKRRREIQLAYNTKHGITPKTVLKAIKDITEQLRTEHGKAVGVLLDIDRDLYKKNPRRFIADKKKQMADAVKELDFETAAIIRDEIAVLMGKQPKAKLSNKK